MGQIEVVDNLLDRDSHHGVWAFLNEPGWRFGAYSDDAGERYHFKHFAGYSASGTEAHRDDAIAEELADKVLPLWHMWNGIEAQWLRGHRLGRCYANRMAPGVGGGLHRDSPLSSHVTAIYYPDIAWTPRDAGETLFYDDQERDVIRAVAPQPNRLVLFSGTIPHVARPRSSWAQGDRITLVFKTLGPPPMTPPLTPPPPPANNATSGA